MANQHTSEGITTAEQAKRRLNSQFAAIPYTHRMAIINMFESIEEAAEKRGAVRARRIERKQISPCKPPAVIAVMPRFDPDIEL
jgi:hypothetical protein